MLKSLLKTCMAVAILAAPLTAAAASPEGARQEPPPMPPRIIGTLNVDELTQAPLQVVYTAHLKAAPQDVFNAVSSTGITKGRIIKSDAQDGILAWSGTSQDVHDHLGVVHLMPTPDGGTGISWSSFFSSENVKNLNAKKANQIQSKIKGWTGKFGGRFTGAAYGTGQLSIISDVIVDAPASKVWAASADDFGSVDQWSSMVGKADHYGSGSDAGRTCHVNMPGNPSVDEKIVSYNKQNKTFAYTVAGAVMPPFVTNALNTWSLKELSNGQTHLRAKMTIDIAEGAPPPAVGMVKGQFFHMLSMGMEEFAYFVGTGNPHARKIASIEMMKKMAAQETQVQ